MSDAPHPKPFLGWPEILAILVIALTVIVLAFAGVHWD